MAIGPGTSIGKIVVNWPHQVRIGSRSSVLDGVTFDYCFGTWRSGPTIVIGDRAFIGRNVEFNCRKRIEIGDDCLIAAGCRLIDHDHGMQVNSPMRSQDGAEALIHLESDVWLGVNVVVLKGVRIGQGAVVAAGAVVTKSIGPNEIWAGVPARRIGNREERRA